MTDKTDTGKPPETLPKKRGRPKGTPKTGGRKKGVKNWTTSSIRDALLEKSDAIDVLADIVAGKQLYAGVSGSVGKAGWRYPTLAQRIQALQILLNKVVPDLKSSELTGADGRPLIPGQETTDKALALAVMSVFQSAGQPIGFLDSAPLDSPPSPVEALEVDEVERSASSTSPHQNIEDPKIGTVENIGNRGARIVNIENEFGHKKFAVYDGFDELHSFRRSRVEAEELAATLNGPSLEMKPGPENGKDGDE